MDIPTDGDCLDNLASIKEDEITSDKRLDDAKTPTKIQRSSLKHSSQSKRRFTPSLKCYSQTSHMSKRTSMSRKKSKPIWDSSISPANRKSLDIESRYAVPVSSFNLHASKSLIKSNSELRFPSLKNQAMKSKPRQKTETNKIFREKYLLGKKEGKRNTVCKVSLLNRVSLLPKNYKSGLVHNKPISDGTEKQSQKELKTLIADLKMRSSDHGKPEPVNECITFLLTIISSNQLEFTRRFIESLNPSEEEKQEAKIHRR